MSDPSAKSAELLDPIIEPGHDYGTVTDKISAVVFAKGFGKRWLLGFTIALFVVQILLISIAYLFYQGVGIWGINVPVGWGFAIINFVWWIGIGHAGTLISAVLFLFRQQWRTSINRFAEAMTLFAVACAGMFPILHLGRPYLFYWLMPYPAATGVWPQFRSPLVWDVFAISTYGTVSLLFWYVGLIPDFGTMRDKAKKKFQAVIFGMLSFGWRGSARHWHRYEMAYLLLAGLATPLVLSVHSIVGLDFAVSIIPGWHVTLFPPYFVAGAIYSGFAMVLTLTIPARRFYDLKDLITDRHVDNMAKVMLATGLMVGYGYMVELFMGWFSGSTAEMYLNINRMFGPYAWSYWTLIFCNVITPQVLWVKQVRRNTIALWCISIIVNIGMWMERFVIVITSLHADYMPSSWDMFYPTIWDIFTYLGTLGFFLMCMFLFMRFIPMIEIFGMRELLTQEKEEEHKEVEELHPYPDPLANFPDVLPAHEQPWGILAEFKKPSEIIRAAEKTHQQGYSKVEAYTPFPVHGIEEALGRKRSRLRWVVLACGLAGGLTGFLLQIWVSVLEYPINVGGKPNYSWPAFIPVTFELTILGASFGAVIGMMVMNKLPQPYHPIFNGANFERASRDRFFLCIEAEDPKFHRETTRSFLKTLNAVKVSEVRP